jgi:hypothetical protein
VERLRSGGHPDDYEKGAREQQKGAGAFTLCDRCNSTTGGWYAPAYTSFAKQGMNYLPASGSAGRFHISLKIHPLRVVKQVICMFMSANGPRFQTMQTDLVRFLLNKEVRHLPSHTRLFAFYSMGDRSRSSGVSGVITGLGSESPTNFVFSEITFPPFGFVLTFNSPPPDGRLADITYLADEFDYKEERVVWIQLPVLPIYTFYPGDYRNRDTVLRQGEQNIGME